MHDLMRSILFYFPFSICTELYSKKHFYFKGIFFSDTSCHLTKWLRSQALVASMLRSYIAVTCRLSSSRLRPSTWQLGVVLTSRAESCGLHIGQELEGTFNVLGDAIPSNGRQKHTILYHFTICYSYCYRTHLFEEFHTESSASTVVQDSNVIS